MNLKKKKIKLHHSKKQRIKNQGFDFLKYFICLDLALLTLILALPFLSSMYTSSFPGTTHHINGYTIQTIPENKWHREDHVTGYTHRMTKNDIYIQGDRPLTEMVETCVHEQLHNMIPNRFNNELEHDFIYSIDYQFVTETCQKYREKLEKIN